MRYSLTQPLIHCASREITREEQPNHDSILLFRVVLFRSLPYNLDWHEISTNPLLKPTQQEETLLQTQTSSRHQPVIFSNKIGAIFQIRYNQLLDLPGWYISISF